VRKDVPRHEETWVCTREQRTTTESQGDVGRISTDRFVGKCFVPKTK